MALIVQKFGGSSVADAKKIFNVAQIVTDTYQAGNDVVVVLSAQGDTTDDLIEKSREINPLASKREMDMLLATGEQISVALVAMAIEKLGYPVVSLTGWQIGMATNSTYSSARIRKVDGSRIREELDKKRIVLVAGFQGINQRGDITTLGRGGSDTTAVALAIGLGADVCQIYTDVEGVYTADPRKEEHARKLREITYDEMLELASLGNQVLHNRSVEMGKRYRVPIEVLSSFSRKPGTTVREVANVEGLYISGVAQDKHIVQFTLHAIDDAPDALCSLLALMAKHKLSVDMVSMYDSQNGKKDIAFTVGEQATSLCLELLEGNQIQLGFERLERNSELSKVSVVGAGMVENPSVAAQMFQALTQAQIQVYRVATSEIKISVLVDKSDSDRAVHYIHERFFGFTQS